MARKRLGEEMGEDAPEPNDGEDTEPEAVETEQQLPVRLSDEQIEEVVGLLRAGRRLPPHLFPGLFEVPKEYELAYRGKTRAVDVLADTMAMPIQPVRTFGEAVDGWSNMLIFGDNLQVLRQLLNMKDAGELRNADGSPGVRVCYIDPPFASAREFSGANDEAAYVDRIAGAEFVEHLRKRLILIRELLSEDGSLYVHLDERKSHYVKVVLDEVFGEGHFEREIVWRIGWVSGYKSAAPNWVRNHESILFYRRGSTKVFNKEYIPYPEGYERRGGTAPTGKGIPLEDTWNCNPADRLDSIQIMSFSREKTGFPTQKNAALVQRIVRASSKPGDVVLDAFVGSGTAGIAAMHEGRRWIGIDSSKFAIYHAQARLLRDDSTWKPGNGFTLYNAGLYDYASLRALPWQRYLAFVLQLFQCRRSDFDLGGVRFHGHIADDPVFVYDFTQHEDARIGRPFVEDLARLCGNRIGGRCFIIAPASVIDLYEDYVTVGNTKFFFLRIPYSIIAELHKKAFSDLRQPTSEARANAAIESVGFDFVVPPRVECRYSASSEALAVEILQFESEAFAAAESEENIADLAMVLVDHDYDGDLFKLDAVHFAENLKDAGWRFSIPVNDAGARILIVYVDLFGNEYRELKKRSDFAGSAASSKRPSARSVAKRSAPKGRVSAAPPIKSVGTKSRATRKSR
jgi:site-specific DNA-methyltransferase (adenine-specific)/adenine-specific DNA-methyltransferase